MAARQKPTFDDRVAEYVDSPRVKLRVRYGKKVAARILGNYGVYRTFVSQTSKKKTGDCSCPSEIWPCKHVEALRATWEANPQSFFDLDRWLESLAKQSKADLIESIGQMVVESPGLLGLFGVPGFEEDGDGENDFYE
jgi:uncharacterized Zn finger protein